MVAGLAVLGAAGGFVYADHVKQTAKGRKTARGVARVSNPKTDSDVSYGAQVGLNADWHQRAWFFGAVGPGGVNRAQGGIYLLKEEDGPGYSLVQRWYVEDPDAKDYELIPTKYRRLPDGIVPLKAWKMAPSIDSVRDQAVKQLAATRVSNPAKARRNPIGLGTAAALSAGAFAAGVYYGETQRPVVKLQAAARGAVSRAVGRARALVTGPRRGDAPTSKRTTGTWAEHTSHGVTDYTRWHVGKKYTIYPKKPGEVYFTVEDEFRDLVGDEQVLPSSAAALALFSKATGTPAGPLVGPRRNPAVGSVAAPADVARMAARGLELRRQFGRGGTAVGVARARDLSNQRPLPESTLRRMASYFARHAVDANAKGSNDRGYWADDENPSAGWIAWLLWGGDSGRAWVDQQLSGLQGRGSR